MRLLLPPLLISVDWFLKKCICVHSTADTALLFYTKWWNFAMLFRKNPKKSSEILQSVAKLVDFFYFLSDFQGIKMRNVSRETLCWNKKLFWCEMDEKTSRRQNKKFFDPTIFQKCWRGSGRVALIAARRQRNPCAMLLAHGGGGEKSDSFSRRGEQDRPALWNLSSKQIFCNCSGGTVATRMPYRKSCS